MSDRVTLAKVRELAESANPGPYVKSLAAEVLESRERVAALERAALIATTQYARLEAQAETLVGIIEKQAKRKAALLDDIDASLEQS